MAEIQLKQQKKKKKQTESLLTLIKLHQHSRKYFNFTNQILEIYQKKKYEVVYFVPAYLRVKVKNIINLDFEKLTGTINIDIILAVYYGDLMEDERQFLEDNMILNFPKNTPIHLKQNSKDIKKSQKKEQKYIQFTVRKILDVQLLNQIKWAPFELLKLIISINLKKIKYYNQKGFKTKFKFNLMDIQGQQYRDLKFSIGSQHNFGFYTIAANKLKVQYTNQYAMPQQKQKFKIERQKARNQGQEEHLSFLSGSGQGLKIREEQSQQVLSIKKIESQNKPNLHKQSIRDQTNLTNLNYKIDCFQYAHFTLTMFKQPNSMAFTIFFPLLLLGVVNIGIFFQQNEQRGKMMLNMAALMISFVALLPSIRENIGTGVGITLAQICIFLEAFTIILTEINMLIRIGAIQGYVLADSGLGIACIIITCAIGLTICSLLLVHQFYWKRDYTQKYSCRQILRLNRRLWENRQCDQQFRNSYAFIEDKINVVVKNMIEKPIYQQSKKEESKEDKRKSKQ